MKLNKWMKLLLLLLIVPATYLLAETIGAPTPAGIDPSSILVNPAELPSWFYAVLTFVQSMPYAGPALIWSLKWLSIISATLTFLATIVLGLGKLAEKLGKTLPWLQPVEKVLGVIWQYVAYLSMYNSSLKISKPEVATPPAVAK